MLLRSAGALLIAAVLLPHVVAPPPDGRPVLKPAKPKCGLYNGDCCQACQRGISDTECDQWTCDNGLQCYMFADARGVAPDGGKGYPMRCFPTPKTCGDEGKPCCYSSDPGDNQRCRKGLTCIVSAGTIMYSSYKMYQQLMEDPTLTTSPAIMGTCRRLTVKDCGKPNMPCGGGAVKMGCKSKQCGKGLFCASPGDTLLDSSRCLPLPPNCGKKDKPCCPPNTGGVTKETWFGDKRTAVPWCSEPNTMCIWNYQDYSQHGLSTLPTFQGRATVSWDGISDRGYGRSRCAPLPVSCGSPGEPCCPAADQMRSGTVYNRLFKYQPCNYAAAAGKGGKGIHCNGVWQGPALLKPGTRLGVCTLNAAECGKVGKKCCLEDLPEVGSVGTCNSGAPPGQYYCTKGSNICTKCPKQPKTPHEKQNCFTLDP